jgi:hypothetical protein
VQILRVATVPSTGCHTAALQPILLRAQRCVADKASHSVNSSPVHKAQLCYLTVVDKLWQRPRFDCKHENLKKHVSHFFWECSLQSA